MAGLVAANTTTSFMASPNGLSPHLGGPNALVSEAAAVLEENNPVKDINELFHTRMAEIPLFAIVCVLGLFLSFFGHKLKKTVLFVIGALLPIFIYRLEIIVSPVIKLVLMMILAIIAGCFFVAYPKFGLAGVGIVGGGVLGRLLFTSIGHFVFSFVLTEELWTEWLDWIDLGVIVVFAAFGAILLAGCFNKLYCVVVPFIGGVLAADAGVRMTILCTLNWIPAISKYFPFDTPLILSATRSQQGQMSIPGLVHHTAAHVGDMADGIVDAAGELADVAIAAAQAAAANDLHINSIKNSWTSLDNFGDKLALFWAPWLEWAIVFLVCFIVGCNLQCKDYQKEKKEKQRVKVNNDSDDDFDFHSDAENVSLVTGARRRGGARLV